MSRYTTAWTWALLALCWGCGAASPGVSGPPETTGAPKPGSAQAEPRQRQEPPPSGEPRDLDFPRVARSTTESGLPTHTVELPRLPLIQIDLVIESGSAHDPEQLQGLAQLTADMLREGTRSRSSAKLAEDVAFLGSHLHVSNDEENIYIGMRVLGEHLDEALDIIADVAMRPRFSKKELGKLKRRELDRLSLSKQNPNYLVRREFMKALYGEHPYAHIDTNETTVKKLRQRDLRRWHRAHFGPNNAFLVVVGDVDEDRVAQSAQKAFKGWRPVELDESEYPEPPERERREVILVDRPESVQSVIFIGNLALPRKSEDYIPLLVANQVLGGSAASRLFMDLRERRSLTYGAYSHVYESVEVAPFRAYAAVRTEVTGQAMDALMEHLERIVSAPPSDRELSDAKRFLIDSFPLRIDTTDKIANLVSELNIYDLPDDYWDRFRLAIGSVSAEQATKAAREHIHPDSSVIVVVGKAAAIKPALAAYGPVTVIDPEGTVVAGPDAEGEEGSTPEAGASGSD